MLYFLQIWLKYVLIFFFLVFHFTPHPTSFKVLLFLNKTAYESEHFKNIHLPWSSEIDWNLFLLISSKKRNLCMCMENGSLVLLRRRIFYCKHKWGEKWKLKRRKNNVVRETERILSFFLCFRTSSCFLIWTIMKGEQ